MASPKSLIQMSPQGFRKFLEKREVERAELFALIPFSFDELEATQHLVSRPSAVWFPSNASPYEIIKIRRWLRSR